MNNVIIYKENLNNFKNYGPALFLDRDGVILEEKHYLSDPKDVKIEKGVLNLLQNAFNSKWKIVIVTNQSGISRGLLTWSDYQKVTVKMIDLLGKPNKILGIYANDEINDNKLNTWRKPSPAMLIEAAKTLNIDLESSILIGDRFSDLLAGFNAKIKKVFHVKTGHGKSERQNIITNINSFGKVGSPKYYSKVFFLDSLLDFDMRNFLN